MHIVWKSLEEQLPEEKVVKYGPGSPQEVPEGGGAVGRTSYLPTLSSGKAAVDISVQRLQSVLLMRLAFSWSYGWSSGMVNMRSWTSVANSGVKEATTYSYTIFCMEILRVVTWANQMWGSARQKGGSLLLVAATVTG